MIKDSLRENVASLLPVITDFESPFWDGLKEKKLFIQRCPECGHYQFPPSPVCISCLSDKVEWVECSGKATLWSRVVFHKNYLEPYPDVPYDVILAKLEEGPIITGRISEENAKKVTFDAPLRLEFVATQDGTVLIDLVPAEQ